MTTIIMSTVDFIFTILRGERERIGVGKKCMDMGRQEDIIRHTKEK
jgi:hypothetical protein